MRAARFIKHLPYALGDSRQLGAGAQGYSFWVSGATGRPVQVGASPDQTGNQAILFGYAFAPKNGRMEPSSFYFSGYPLAPANAPVVSQNYTDWAPTRPDPRRTWDQVAGLDPRSLPACQLFDPPPNTRLLGATPARAPTWSHIGRWRPRAEHGGGRRSAFGFPLRSAELVEALSSLAPQKEGPSTSSGRTGGREGIRNLRLAWRAATAPARGSRPRPGGCCRSGS